MGAAEEDLLDGGFQERPLLLDDHHLVETVRELDDGVTFEGEDHAEFEDPDPVPCEVLVGETDDAQGLADVEVGLAGRQDADPVRRPALDHAVEAVEPGVLHGAGEPDLVQAALERHEIGAEEHRARLVRAGAQVALHDRDPIACHDGRGRRVSDRGGDLQARPHAAEPGEELGVQPEVEDVLRIGRVQRRDRQVRECRLAGARHAGRLGSRIVADQSDSATGRARAHQVRVAQGIGGAVEAGGLAIPDAHDAVAP
ncbi:hypothetical protein ACIGPN_01370 [Streptomyces afghaniensis]|uniref:hypothetical protein n=1 Tax=Streptomyces afghaniensis TaxID=66865 RepID=UPI0037CDADEB